MRPKAVPVLTGKEAERFEEQDKKPLEKEQKDFLAECLALYKSNPIRKQVVFLSDDKISLEDLDIFHILVSFMMKHLTVLTEIQWD